MRGADNIGWNKALDYDDQWYFLEYDQDKMYYQNTVWIRKHIWNGYWEHTNRKQLEWSPLFHANNADEAMAAALSIWRMT